MFSRLCEGGKEKIEQSPADRILGCHIQEDRGTQVPGQVTITGVYRYQDR